MYRYTHFSISRISIWIHVCIVDEKEGVKVKSVWIECFSGKTKWNNSKRQTSRADNSTRLSRIKCENG